MNENWKQHLREYQKEGATWLNGADVRSSTRGRLLAFVMGLGKTRAALAAARLRFEENGPAPLIITCPAIARSDWAREASVIWPELKLYIIGLHDKRKDSTRPAAILRAMRIAVDKREPTAFVTSYQSANWLGDVVVNNEVMLGPCIIDEAHHLKKEQKSFNKSVQPIGVRSEAMFLTTGTPIHDKASDLHALLKLCSLKFTSKWSFIKKYFAIETSTFGSKPGRLIDPEGLRRDIAPYVMYRTAEDCISELPPKIRTVKVVETSAVIPRITREAARARAGEQIDAMLREMAALKIDAVVSFIVNELADLPVVAYAYERQHANEIARRLTVAKTSVTLATGDVTPSARAKRIEQWKVGCSRVLVCTLDAVRESATLTRAKHMCFLDVDWLYSKVLQVEGRIDPTRQPEGQRAPANYYYFAVMGGPDEIVIERVIEKMRESDSVFESKNVKDWVSSLNVNAQVSESEILEDLMARLVLRDTRTELL